MEARQLSRQAIRALLEDHVRQQFRAEAEGRWHAVQNDINDELAEHRARIAHEVGDLEAERFSRIYVEEQLAYERDARANPAAAARRMAGDADTSRPPTSLQNLQITCAPQSAGSPAPWAVVILILAGAAALLF